MTRRRPISIQNSIVSQREVTELERAGISAAKARLFVSGLNLPGVLPDANAESRARHIEAIHSQLAADAQKGMSEETVLLRAFEWVLHQTYNYDDQPWKLTDQAAMALIEHCRKGKVDFGQILNSHFRELDHSADTCVTLARLGIIDPSSLIDRDALIRDGATDDWIAVDIRPSEETEVTDLLFWLKRAGPSVLSAFTLDLANSDGHRALCLARGISKEISRWLHRQGWHYTAYSLAGEEFALEARKLFDAIDSQMESSHHSVLKPAWLRFALMACDGDPGVLADARDRVLKAAIDEMGLLRPLLRSAREADATDRFRKVYDHWRTCMTLVYRLGGLWAGTKALLHAFRALNTPALASDLRYWNDPARPSDPAPPHWCMIPMHLYSMFHSWAGKELQGDPDLVNFRTEFARYCLDRLKTRKARKPEGSAATSLELIEPDAYWRECLVHAVTELHVNPGGKGHHVLNWVSQNDPNEHVRAVAKQSYAALRHGPSLPKGLSPRRAVIHAFWWLSQAHLLSLNVEMDQHGAQRTRELEVRRTNEAEVA